MGTKFKELQTRLDTLGYRGQLLPECVPLVEKLLSDLNTTTSSLQKYMRIAQEALEERDLLKLAAEPYKCDNSKLIKECNDLHLAFIHFKERHEKIQRELRNQISGLQTQLENCNLDKEKLLTELRHPEENKVHKGSKTNLQSKRIDAKVMASAEVIHLTRQIKDLEERQLQLIDETANLKTQLKNRDEEINRLRGLAEDGRPYQALSKECCYKNIDSQIVVLQDEITRLKREKNDLQTQMKEALAKQHEAMRRALHLAERNQQLEKEMREIDQIALAVEKECNNKVKGNTEKVERLRDRINESLVLIQQLERENAQLKQAKLELSADLEAVKLEKMHLQKQLDKEAEDKKKLTEKINNLTIIENGLNAEIDRLSRETVEQKRRIEELHSLTSPENKRRSSILSDMASSKQTLGHKRTSKKRSSKDKSPTKGSRSPSKLETAESLTVTAQKCCCESGDCIKNLRELLEKEVEYRQLNAKRSLEDLKQEKDYYMKEYHRVLEQTRNAPTTDTNGTARLRQQLNDKDNQIKQLENELSQLRKQKSASILFDDGTSDRKTPCNNPTCKNRERELDVKTNELTHLEIENNTLKAKLQAINETTTFNEERMKKAFKDMESHIRKLEDERRDLVKSELTQRSSVSQLGDGYKQAMEQLKQVQMELTAQRANYDQLKALHEQTDRALADAQAQVARAETELADWKAKVRDSSRDTAVYDREIAKLTADVQFTRGQLTKLDREKDELMNKLDEKTERVVLLEEELSTKEKQVSRLEAELKDLNRKLSKHVSESSSQEQIARSKQQELDILERDYEKEKRMKDAAIQENKRLQNDLACVTCDCRDARNELAISRREVEDLKRQLQQYVAEVKRTEDLINQKELERNELLDQFRSLSQEATVLESNNHCLESEATQSKIQLSVALDHSTELEKRLDHQENVIKSYEKQIAELTAQVARLEMQLKQKTLEHEEIEVEMRQMRELCVKLDRDKDELQRELRGKDETRAEVDAMTKKFRAEREAAQKALDRERSNLEAVEKLLNEARRDATEQRLLNQDLQREVAALKQKIDELEDRLTATAEQLDIYRTKATEYGQQVKRLRRDIANERFSKTRFDSKSSFPSL